MSFALRHKQRCLAQAQQQALPSEALAAQPKAAPAATTSAARAKNRYDQTVTERQLERDLARLAETPDVSEKIALKKTLLPQYLTQVQAYRDRGAKHPNPLLVYCVIWLLDVEEIEQALALAECAIGQQQKMPAGFKRDLPTFVTETVHDWAQQQYQSHRSASPYFDQVVEAVHSERWLVAQIIVQSKIYKLMGQFAERGGALTTALHWYQHAQTVNDKAGVKSRIDALTTRLQKLQPT